ncbi:MAG: thiamine diphosphokinase [Candidatus Diapherotrites archaeon]|uniref:Thiamine diphosphokinase n=1 Tax=Candidatus Iainarchaeum sp. TaxID=3101447 RepID=A0A8T3YLH4_9ARCH|nr:thiamine diphosphokinase [Candidatus Diapherotrites archaeon]
MKRAVLVCNGSVSTKQLYSTISREDFLIAVDGGANKLVKTRFVPDLVIGDMDSINKAALRRFRQCSFLRFPREKPELDLELALSYCAGNRFHEVLVLGAIGTRADMSLTNIFLLSGVPEGIDAKIVHDGQEIFLMRKGRVLHGVPGERISIFPIGGDARCVTLTGFRYALSSRDVPFGLGLGLSNEFISKKAKVSFKSGMLLCVHFHDWF